MSYQLICEGACNPAIHDLDLRIYHALREARGDRPPIGDDRLHRDLRTLTHTSHIDTSQEFVFRCLVCGTTRRWGNSKWDVKPIQEQA